MNVSPTPKLAALVAERVRSGRYQSASEVVSEALRLLEDVEEVHAARLKELRKEIAAGLKDLDRGRSFGSTEILRSRSRRQAVRPSHGSGGVAHSILKSRIEIARVLSGYRDIDAAFGML